MKPFQATEHEWIRQRKTRQRVPSKSGTKHRKYRQLIDNSDRHEVTSHR